MKTITKLFIAVMVGVPTLFTACSEPEVSDEVTALRQSQADLVAEKVQYQRLQNALQELENALKALQNQRDEADIQRQIAEDMAAIEEANLELQQALDDLADYLRTQGLVEAAGHLGNYGNQTASANLVLEDIVELEADIVRMQAFIDVDKTDDLDPSDFSTFTDILENRVILAQAEVTSLQNSIAALEAVAEDPTALEIERNQVKADSAALEIANKELETDKQVAQSALSEANAILTRAKNVIAFIDGGTVDEGSDDEEEVDGFVAELADAQDAVTAAEDNIASSEAAIAAAEAEISQLQDLLVPYESQLASATATFNSELATAQSRFNSWREARNELDAIDVNFDLGDQEYDDAALARDNARTLFEDVAGNYIDGANPYDFGSVYDMANDNGHGDFQEAASGNGIQDWLEIDGQAGTTFGDAKIAFDQIAAEFAEGGTAAGYQSDIEDLEGDIDTEQGKLAGYQDELATALNNVDELTANIAGLQAEYDDAVANLDAFRDNIQAPQNEVDRITVEIAANNLAIANYGKVITALTNEIDQIRELLDDLYDDLEGNDEKIGALEKLKIAQDALADNNVSLEEWSAIIEQMEQELAFLNEEYLAHLTLAEAYLAAYYAALNNAG
ncbi:MAG: hypothetical protein AAGC43_03660 [Bacteroidota bacterium]